MRLIDIDAFYKFCDESLKSGHEVYPEYYDDYLDSDMFTVNAIPIEWLYQKRTLYLENKCYMSLMVINEILNWWEEENEQTN